MSRAIYPGTFDPITNGHIDIIKRAIDVFGKVIVGVVKNPSKETLFSYSQRLQMVKTAVRGLRAVTIEGFDGLVVEFAQKKKTPVIVRGLRMISDFEYEFQMALTNRSLASNVETLFLMPHAQYSYISSRLIKEAAFLGADLSAFLPRCALKALKIKVDESRSRTNKG